MSETHFQVFLVSLPADEKRESILSCRGVYGPSLEVMYIILSTFHWLKLDR